jgi:hypothetical protein
MERSTSRLNGGVSLEAIGHAIRDSVVTGSISICGTRTECQIKIQVS